ncbi:MAG: MATE family efflux transporter [Clostridia bacterium]|nr:MATE family efflux transporter [Clostridia bacterium]
MTEEQKQFYKMAVSLTLPIALQNLMDTAVSGADVLMLNFVSQSAISASSLAGQVQFVLNMIFYGLSSGTAVLCSQYWGRGDRRTIEKIMGISLRISVCISLLFTLAGFFIPELIMKIFTNDTELISLGAQYLRAVAPGYVCSGFATMYLCVMRSVERVIVSAAVHSAAVFVNIGLNACFIFGVGPFPALGIAGVALATSITRMLEVVYCVLDAAFFCRVIRFHPGDLIARRKVLMRDFIRYSVPAMGNDIVWGLAFSMYSVILGHISSDIVAANSITTVVRSLGTVVCFGVSSAGGIILGKAMGDNQLEKAELYGKRLVKLSVLTALFGGGVVLLVRPLLLAWMDVTAVVHGYLSVMLLITAYYIMGQSVNTMLVCGVFRAGGDTRFGLYCDIISMWVYAVPVGLLAAFVLKLPPLWVYFILCLDEFVKMPVIVAHYKKKKWLRNITRAETD